MLTYMCMDQVPLLVEEKTLRQIEFFVNNFIWHTNDDVIVTLNRYIANNHSLAFKPELKARTKLNGLVSRFSHLILFYM